MRLLTYLTLCFTALAFIGVLVECAPMPSPIQRFEANKVQIRSPNPTPKPRHLHSRASENEIYEFYKPVARWADEKYQNVVEKQSKVLRSGKKSNEFVKKEFAKDVFKQAEQMQSKRDDEKDEHKPTPVKRSDSPSVPLSELGPPSFPAQYPSCVNCQAKYSSISSCMQASSVFQNATNIFNSPWSYIAVIKCACTDTFQAVYPQCVQCFQLTDQCYYLGTDPVGTGAPEIVTNIRQICAFGSSLLGGSESADFPNWNNSFTLSVVPSYTDATQTGPGYQDQATGAIFGAASHQSSVHAVLPFLFITTLACLSALLFL